MNKTTLKKIKERLLQEKHDVLKKNKSMSEVSLDTEGDEIDEIQAELIFGVVNKLSEKNQEKLINIIKSISKIEDKTYGICEECEEEIEEKRLLANPYFSICISCAETKELKKNKR